MKIVITAFTLIALFTPVAWYTRHAARDGNITWKEHAALSALGIGGLICAIRHLRQSRP